MYKTAYKPFLFFTFQLLYSILFSSINCSVDMAGFGSETTNGTVVGIVIDTSGSNKADNTQISLIPAQYNPAEEYPTGTIYKDTTDRNGTYSINVEKDGNYTIYGIDLNSQKMLIRSNVYIHNDTITSIDTLKDPGSVRILLPDTVDTVNGYIYIEGTYKFKSITNCIVLGGGYYTLLIDSIPSGVIPAIHYIKKEGNRSTITISDSSIINSNKILDIGAYDIQKPIWRFSFVAGIPEQTSTYFGGLDSIKKLIEKQFVDVNKKFNDPKVFKGILHFAVDSFYIFTTSIDNEIKPPPNNFDYRILYEGLSAQDVGKYSKKNRTIHHTWKINGLFGKSSLDLLTWELGRTRECWGLNWLKFKADKNPVNNQGYYGMESIMNYPYGENKWDEFSINVVNYYADKINSASHILNSAFPASIGVVVKDEMGSILNNVKVHLYGIGWSEPVVDTPAVYSGITDSNGEYIFSLNPYDPDNAWPLEYANFLVSAINSNDTTYAWMPITEVANKWFEDANSDYRLIIHF